MFNSILNWHSTPCACPPIFLELAAEERASACLRVLFGQAVKLGGASFGVVRIALGADMIIDAFFSGNPSTTQEKEDPVAEKGAIERLIAQVKIKPF